MGQGRTETFLYVAIQYAGKTFVGPNHLVIFDHIKDLYPEATEGQCRPGFVMTSNHFLTRKDAKRIAHELGVLRHGHDKFVDPDLFSEYLISDTIANTGCKEVASG